MKSTKSFELAWFGRGPRTYSGKPISLLEISKLGPMLVLEYDFGMAAGVGAEC